MTNSISTISRSLAQLGQFSAPLSEVMPRLRTAGRVGLHASGLMSGWASALPVDDVDLSFFKKSFTGAMELHARVLSEPGKREALSRAEREDLFTLPVFLAAMLPDIGRVRHKQRNGLQDAIQQEDGTAEELGPFEHFEAYFNEPYFRDYTRLDLPELFARHGLRTVKRERWFLSTLLVLRKEG